MTLFELWAALANLSQDVVDYFSCGSINIYTWGFYHNLKLHTQVAGQCVDMCLSKVACFCLWVFYVHSRVMIL